MDSSLAVHVQRSLIIWLRQRRLLLQFMQNIAILAELFGSTTEIPAERYHSSIVESSSSVPADHAGEITRDFALVINELLSAHVHDHHRYNPNRLSYILPSSSTFARPASSTMYVISSIYDEHGGEILNSHRQEQAYPRSTIFPPCPTSLYGGRGAVYRSRTTDQEPTSRLFESSLPMLGQLITTLLTIMNINSNSLGSPSARFFWYFTVLCTVVGFFLSLHGLLVSGHCLDRFPFDCNAKRRMDLIASVATAFGFIGALCMCLPNSVTMWVTAALACAACTPLISSIFNESKQSARHRAGFPTQDDLV